MARTPILQRLLDHIGLTSGPHGATSAATASRIMARDASGRAKVAAPSAADDIVNLGTLNTAVGNIKEASTSVLGITRYATNAEVSGMSSNGVVRASQISRVMAAAKADIEAVRHMGILGGSQVSTWTGYLSRTFGIVYSASPLGEGRVQVNLSQSISNYLVLALPTRGDDTYRYVAWRELTSTSFELWSWRTEENPRDTSIHFLVV